LQNLAADEGESQKMERSMHRWQSLVANLEPAGLPDPSEATFHHVADLTQATAVRRPLPRQVILDPPLLQPLLVARRAVLPITVQGIRPAPPAAAGLADRRYIIQQRHRFKRLVPLRPGDAHGQRRPVAIDEQVAFRAFFGSIRGVFAGEDPPKTAR
jgi:hypothetical protein